ncbi:hypothetical protein DM860_002911 [Cuscuta australis]|uniref:Cell differentiation protein rcd1 n=1 Tax=Cuscuta australis TaxID=267555 RepID=A0A328D4K2_9ASTE|nr:hypothetical protein DM860_002911 [Cuscuta australis]
MENLPETFYVDPTRGTPPITTAFAAARLSEPSPEELLLLLHRPSRREDALAVLVTSEDGDGKQIVHFLLKSEVFPMCLRCMDLGDELTQTVSALVIVKIVMEEEGLKYCSGYGDRFFSLVQVLGRVVEKLPERRPSLCLLRLLIRCYLRLSQSPRAMDAFKNCIPARMTQEKFINFLRVSHK